jgi:hypothetical protein
MILLLVSSAYNSLNVNVKITSAVPQSESTHFKAKFVRKVALQRKVKRCLGDDDVHQVACL